MSYFSERYNVNTSLTMNARILHANVRKASLLLPALILVVTLGLLYMCVSHDFIGFFRCGYLLTGSLVWFVFSLVFVGWMTAFFLLLFSDPGSMQNEMQHFKGQHNCRETCQICGVVKPVRAHHCKRCGFCYARMDHHCDGLGFCIALRNMKIFILFLLYSIVMLVIYAVSSFAMLFVQNSTSPYMLVFDIFAGGTLAVLLGILVGGHIHNILVGRTPLEDTFGIVVENDKSRLERFMEVFGPPSLKWILPIPLGYDEVSPFIWEKYRNTQETKKEK